MHAGLKYNIEKIPEETVSNEELENVSAGVKKRDWLTEGCAATVEIGSNCWRTDGSCTEVNIMYRSNPNAHCKKCGAVCSRGWVFVQREHGVKRNVYEYRCRNCGIYEEIIYGERGITLSDLEQMEQDTRALFRFWISTLRRKKEEDC